MRGESRNLHEILYLLRYCMANSWNNTENVITNLVAMDTVGRALLLLKGNPRQVFEKPDSEVVCAQEHVIFPWLLYWLVEIEARVPERVVGDLSMDDRL